MNEPEKDLQPIPRSVDNEEKTETLRRQINLLFGGLIITSFTVTAYLGLQARRSSMDLLAVKPRAVESLRVAQQEELSAQSIFAKLTDFARTHPDFQKQVFAKYRINSNAPPAAVKK